MSRRRFLGAAGALGASGVTLPSILGSARVGAAPRPARRPASGDAGSLFFENWPEYIDLTEDGHVGTVDRFIEATGIDMTYSEAFNDNNEYFARIQPVLGRGETIEPDIIAPTSWLAGRLVMLEWVDKLPLDQIPNAANLRDDLVKPAWDPSGEYTLPWQTGFAGIAYNLEVTGRELTSTEDLFDPEFKGKIGMLTEMRDTIGLILLSLGVDISTIESFDEAAEAFEKLEQAKSDGQIRSFTGNDYISDLETGNFAACIGWSGDVASLSVDNPNIRFVIPEEGGTSWADAMVLPKGAANVEQAAKWMDFVYDPEQAAQITAYVQYVSPVKGVQEEVAKIDPELAENPLVFPDEETISRVHTFANLSEDVEAEFDEAFSSIVGA
ncbi:ABC transporter substrate-binding protein [Desertimonas flava]|jgi:spermidine/putrescine transport system substrate-binding protein|nr:spermidine/putrescine ABC transporter substrate-binding protein [Desertimonas flava]